MQRLLRTDPTYIGPFSSWEEAEDYRSSLAPDVKCSVFSTEAWLGRQWRFAMGFLEQLEVGFQESAQRSTTLPLLVASSTSTRIVDLGGGSAWPCIASAPLSVGLEDYTVLERQPVCDFFEGIVEPPVRYVCLDSSGSLDSRSLVTQIGLGQFDIVYANSSLQYARTNVFLADVIRVARAQWILLDDLLLTHGQTDAFAVQVNSDFPEVVRFLSFKKLHAEVSKMGYRLHWRMPFATPGYVNWTETSDSSTIPALPQPETLLFRKAN